MKNNKRGALTLAVLAPYIIGVGAAVISYGATKADYSLRNFREGKAVGYCVAGGDTQEQCVNFAKNLSNDDLLDFIKDTQESPK